MSEAALVTVLLVDPGANCCLTTPVDVEHLLRVVQSIEEFWFGVVRLPAR